MKFIIILAFVAMAAARPEDDFSRYDNFDIDEATSNLRLLKAYLDCFLDIGKCTPEGNDFKKWIPESVQDSCSKCTPKQKVFVAKVILALQANFSDGWENLNKRYNPEGKHDETIKAFLDQYGH